MCPWGSVKLNIEQCRASGGLMEVQYWAPKGLGWVHWSSILGYGTSPVGSLMFNIWIFSYQGSWVGSLMATEGSGWAHWGSILGCGMCPLGSWRLIIELWRGSLKSNIQLLWVSWAHSCSILMYGEHLVGSLKLNIDLQRPSGGLIKFNIELPKVSDGFIKVEDWTMQYVRWALRKAIDDVSDH